MQPMPPVKAITSRDNPLLIKLRKLIAQPASYRKSGELWLEGEHLCTALVQRGGFALQAVITETAWATPALRQLASTAAAVAVVPGALMSSLSSLESPAPLGFLVALPANAALIAHQPSVVLDRLQDAGNVGNILRSAAAFGCTQVVALIGTVALWSPKVLRAGMGAHFGLHLVENVTHQALAALQLPLLHTSSHADQAVHEAALPWPCAWVMGHEGQGVSPELAQRCAFGVRIAQPGGEESLNVAAAAAVCLYESTRQRGVI
jgi:RNA methyltransferase, TrmH family